MRNFLLLLILFAFFACQKKTTIPEKIDAYLKGQAAVKNFNGNVLVADKGNIIYAKSFGYADFNTKQLLNDSSVFELASVSKQFTALGILMLQEKGKLKISDSLRQYFPELPYHNITIREMLTHTSGLPDYMEVMDPKWDHKKIAFNNDMIAFLAKEKPALLFKPGTKWEYSNTAYAILASIIEKASGMTYHDFLETNIFKPLGMKHSRVWNTRRSNMQRITNYAYGVVYSDSLTRYILPDEDPKIDIVYYLDGIEGDGTVNSTTSDLLLWDRSLKNHTLAKEETIKEMLRPQSLSDTVTSTYYGYGVSNGKNEFGNFYGHSGGWPGYVTYYTHLLDDDKTIIILSNNESSSPAISGAIAQILYNKPVVMPYEHKAITLDSATVHNFIGNYEVKGKKFKIKMHDSKLMQQSPSGAKRSLLPESETKLFVVGRTDAQFEIEKQNSGKPPVYYFISFGVKNEVHRLPD